MEELFFPKKILFFHFRNIENLDFFFWKNGKIFFRCVQLGFRGSHLQVNRPEGGRVSGFANESTTH
jgi:hypothetical protein